MTESTTTAQAPQLLDPNGNHRQKHGAPLQNVIASNGVNVTRGGAPDHAGLQCHTARYGSVGGATLVSLRLGGAPMVMLFEMTPDDAEAMADNLRAAAATARAVDAMVAAGALA